MFSSLSDVARPAGRTAGRLLARCGVLLLLLGALAPGLRAQTPAERELVVMSYNILVGIGPVPSWDGVDPRPNLTRIAAAIREAGADIVLLQEVDHGADRSGKVDETAFLRERLGYHGVFAPALKRSGGDYGIALLSRWPIVEHRVLRLYKPDYSQSHPSLPDYFGEQRVAVVARVRTPWGDVTVTNTHLGLTQDQRAHQLSQLAAVLEEAALQGPVIFGGDLNAEPDAAELLPVRRLLRDAYHGFRTEEGLVRNLPIAQRMTFPFDEPRTCIDYLFVSDRDFDVLQTEVPAVLLSDHRPVVSRLRFKAR